MNAQERLRHTLDAYADSLCHDIPFRREDAVVAVVRALDRRASGNDALLPDIVTGRHMPALGGNLALRICLEVAPPGHGAPHPPDTWADQLLTRCEHHARAEMVLAHCETGFMHLADESDGTFDAWIATKHVPASWRERDDIDWWASSLARRHRHEMEEAASRHAYHDMAAVLLKTMTCQVPYPADTVIGGHTVQTWLDILGLLIAHALEAYDRGEAATVVRESELAQVIAGSLSMAPEAASRAIAAFAIDTGNAAWHGATPGIAAAPLIRVEDDRVVFSHHGLTTEPLFFLFRELRRRDPEDYHNTALAREIAFRRDLYAVFEGKRFVTSENRIRLRRDTGNLRTDIDAAVFDRKTGTLGIFELKSQDPGARSVAALARQRDNLLYANRQLSGTLDWIRRHGADEIVRRLDPQVARTARAHKVFPFVLGRYLAPSGDGEQPDPRAAWATWPAVLRELDAKPIDARDANPIASLHARLTTRTVPPRATPPACDVRLGDVHIRVHPSRAAYRASRSDEAATDHP